MPEVQRHGQPVATHVGSLCARERSACASQCKPPPYARAAQSGIFSPPRARALERAASPHYDFGRGKVCGVCAPHRPGPGRKRQNRYGLASRAGRGVAEVDAQPGTSSTSLTGGHLLAAISTSIVGILRDHYGRGPMKAKTYVLDDIIVVVMRGSGFTPLEQTIMDSGQPDRVIAMREDFQRVMAAKYRQKIEALTGRKVLAFLSQAHVEPDITMEIFFVDGPLEGFGAVEITDPE